MIGIIAAFVVLIIRTQTALPEGVVYGIAVANLASPIIDKYTVGLTNQFLKQRYALLSGLMVLSIGLTVLPTLASEVAVIPYATYRGEYSSYFSNYDGEPTTLIVDVGVDRSFNIVKIDIISGISSPDYAQTWANQGPSIINTYLSMNVDELLSLDYEIIPQNLNITNASITPKRLLIGLQQAFKDVVVYKGSAQSYACEECYSEDIVDATVYVDSANDKVIGVHWSGTITTGEPYSSIVQGQLEFIQDFYIGETVSDILTNFTPPTYPNFNPNVTDKTATISFNRLHQSLFNALGAYYG
jgi:hypothetical protein